VKKIKQILLYVTLLAKLRLPVIRRPLALSEKLSKA
jgi:hypothetical protein